MKDCEASQIGGPEEITTRPTDNYVRDFTEDVPRCMVLSAGKVMRSLNGGYANTETVSPTSKFDAHVEWDADSGWKIVGEIDRAIIMRAMNTRSGKRLSMPC